MLCMFFHLEDEAPTGYSDVFNQRKLSLLNSNLEVLVFFFELSQEKFTKLILYPTRFET